MFRRRPIHAAATALAGTSTTATAARTFTSTTSQIWITIMGHTAHACTNGRSWTLHVPLEVSVNPTPSATSLHATGQTGHGMLHRSRTLLAPHGASSSPSGNASTTAAITEDAEPRGPYDVTIDEALLGSDNANTARTTVRDLVCLLVNPDAEARVEAVSLRDFVAMAPSRQLRAVNNDQECLNILLSSERYQSERDARALRMVGVTTVGQWREQPDRVPLSAYGRGVLSSAYNALARHRQQSQKDLVVAWLTRTIQRAVAEELMAPRRLSSGVGDGSAAAQMLNTSVAVETNASSPLMHVDAGERDGTNAAYTTTFFSPDTQSSEKSTKAEEGDDASAASGSRRRGPRQRPVVSQVDNTKAKAAAAQAGETDDAVEQTVEDVDAEHEEEMDPEMADLIAEAEAVLKTDALPAAPATATAPFAKVPTAAGMGAAQAKVSEAEGAEEEVEEVEEVIEEVLEEEEEHDEVGKETAAAATTTTPSSATTAQQKEKLARLAELMLKQFNTADGYLHPTNKAERKEQEQRGDILVLDEDTAQVDPLTMFSAYHAATVTEADPVSVRALKTIWTSYNKHQMALEEASNEASVEFYKRESVNALLYGSVLMRALAREEQVVVLEGTSLPPYGFPLVSSDTRPFNSSAASSSASSSSLSTVTDMTPAKVPEAMQAYKVLFGDKEKRYSPFRPDIDQNAGCSVVRLSGTTLHLFYTSKKDHIMEEEVRLPFAEVLLGMLHLLRQKVLPRVNVIHYHLIATKPADAAADAYSMLRSAATLDLTNPFTKEEHARLKALAAPLGMAEEMDEFRCIDDVVMEIEDNSGASVVHSLLHNREDLEATLTATLAQLLPEDVEGEATAATAAEEEAEEEVEEVEDEDVAADDDEELEVAAEEDDAEDVETAVQPDARTNSHAPKTPQRHPAPPVVPTIRRSAASPAAAAKENVTDEEAELEEAIYTQWQKQKEQQQQHRAGGRGHAGSAKATSAARAAATAEVADEDMEEVEVEEEGDVEEEFEAEEEEVKAPSPTTAAGVRMTRSSAYQSRQSAPPNAAVAAAASPSRRNIVPHTRTANTAVDEAAEEEEEEEEFEEEEEVEVEEVEEDEEDDMEVVTAPALPRSPAGRRAVPVEVAEAEETPHRPTRAPQPHQQRSTRHQPPTSSAAAALSSASVEPEDEDAPPPLPQVRTRRRAARRLSARARVPVQLDEEAYDARLNEGDGGETSDAAADEDRWFKRPKRRYVE